MLHKNPTLSLAVPMTNHPVLSYKTQIPPVVIVDEFSISEGEFNGVAQHTPLMDLAVCKGPE